MRMQQLVGLTALTLGVTLLATGQGRKSASVVKAEAGKIGIVAAMVQ